MYIRIGSGFNLKANGAVVVWPKGCFGFFLTKGCCAGVKWPKIDVDYYLEKLGAQNTLI